jgi:hypothetical protein
MRTSTLVNGKENNAAPAEGPAAFGSCGAVKHTATSCRKN